MLKSLPSLLGGLRKIRFNSVISTSCGKCGLQYNTNSVYASAMFSSDTSFDGRARWSGIAREVFCACRHVDSCGEGGEGDMAVLLRGGLSTV